MPDSWIQDFEYRIQSTCRELGRRWIVAVSGGSDSVGLLRILHSHAACCGLELSVAHLNHGTRAEAAEADASHVATLAARLGLPFDLGHWQPTRAGHFEVDARQARYAWLTDLARNREASVVAVGHTSDDQAETVLHRILRGTGPHGLSGMLERRVLASEPVVTLLRPLLSVTREQVRHYLSEIGQAFREDETNTDLHRTRSRLRHDLIPKLEAEYNPQIKDALNRLARTAAASNRVVSDRLDGLEPAVILLVSEERLVIDRRVLGTLREFEGIELIRRAWDRAGWPEREMSTARWLRLHRFMARDTRRSRLSLGSGVDARLKGDQLILSREASS